MSEQASGEWMVDGLPSIDPNLDDFYEAWHWLAEHPYFHHQPPHGEPGFADNLYMMVVRVNPATETIEDDESLNTQARVWLENGPYRIEYGRDQHCHDIYLDCGGATFEEAIREMARLVMEQQGDYPEWRTCSHCLKPHPSGPTDSNEEWFHSPECEEHGPYELLTRPVPGRDNIVAMIPSHEQFGCEHFPAP